MEAKGSQWQRNFILSNAQPLCYILYEHYRQTMRSNHQKAGLFSDAHVAAILGVGIHGVKRARLRLTELGLFEREATPDYVVFILGRFFHKKRRFLMKIHYKKLDVIKMDRYIEAKGLIFNRMNKADFNNMFDGLS